MDQEILASIDLLKAELEKPFYTKIDFWIGFALGMVGIVFSIISYREAKKAAREARAAKEAAKEAGRAVKIQTVTIELTEIIQRLDTIDGEITYQSARDFYSEINRRVRRIVAPYKNDSNYTTNINPIIEALNNIQESLRSARPINLSPENNDGVTVYFAIEASFSILSGALAELCGILEQKTTE